MEMVGIILAAGRSRRFGSDKSKVLIEFGDEPMVAIVARAMSAVVDRTIVVVGENRDEVADELSGMEIEFVIQEEQMGTGHAVMVAEGAVSDPGELVITSYADKPLVQSGTFKKIADEHIASGSKITVVVAMMDDPRRKGRVVRDADGQFSAVVEYRDATEEQRAIHEVHAGFLCAEAGGLFERLKRIEPGNVAGEYYLTDVYHEYVNDGLPVNTCMIEASHCWDVNTIDDLKAIVPSS